MERFTTKINKTDTCWLWTAGLTKGGYGQFGIGKKKFSAHRFAYELWVGPIPHGMVIDHLCRVKACVRPEHLEAVSQKVNLNRGEHGNTKKTHCIHGHEFTPENTYVRKTGGRKCKTCTLEAAARSYEKQRQAVVTCKQEVVTT